MLVNGLEPLDWFLPGVNTLHLNARPIPGFQVGDYAALIASALEEGLIQLSTGGQPLNLLDARVVVTECARKRQAREDKRVYMGMTELGGIAWEHVANPQWDRFFMRSFLVPDMERRVSATLASRNRDAVMAYLGWFERLESVDVNWETVRIEAHSNYAVTYWKRLDGVQR